MASVSNKNPKYTQNNVSIQLQVFYCEFCSAKGL
jgi:hypothetical protein